MCSGRSLRAGASLSLILVVGLISAPAGALAPAFPGAEGAGAYAVGGRNGDVYHVTNLANSGTGSLRYGIENAPSNGRTIVFDVSGTIALSSTLRIRNPYITIAGQTAPGLGICITNWDTQIEYTHDVILRHLRFRPGLAKGGTASSQYHGDSLELNGDSTRPIYNIMIDHCSASWSVDECMGYSGTNTNVTYQWCYITEGLNDTGVHPYGPGTLHSAGSLLAVYKDACTTVHHSLYAHQKFRMPRVRSYDYYTHTADIRNNVMYDWGDAAAYGGGSTSRTIGGVTKNWYDDRSYWNYCGNYSIAGPSTLAGDVGNALEDWGQGIDPNGILSTWDMKVYQSGNKIDSDRNHVLDGVDNGWDMTTVRVQDRMSTPFAIAGMAVTMDPVDIAYQRVLAESGAMPLYRDSVDARITDEVLAQTGSIIDSQKDPNDLLADPNGYPIIPIIFRPADWDTDSDGMPGWWEVQNGLDPNADDHLGDLNRNGYTDLEDYLNYMNNVVVPEPTCLSLALLGGLSLLARKRRAGTN
jgi:pectate lyase